MVAYMGRSAKDNLALLRSAQAWDLWLHLKDYPSAHVIIRRPRGQEISQEEIARTARWLAQEATASKRELRAGDTFEIQFAECRYVRPIKGDRLGRVTVLNPKVLRLKL
jgi:predicted ribosome quality control (RQC) complex YloA/Tae2 family protein